MTRMILKSNKVQTLKPSWNVFEEIDAACTVPRILALCPYILRHGTFQLSFKLLFITTLHLTATVSFVIYSYAIFSGKTDLKLVYRSLLFIDMVTYLSSLLSLVLPLAKMNHFNRAVAYMYLVDRHLEQLGFGRNRCSSYWKSRVIHWLIGSTVISYKVSLLPLTKIPIFLFLCWPAVINVFFLDQIASILATLQSRLELLIDRLEDTGPLSTEMKRLTDFSRCHNLLCNSGKLLNQVYSGSFLFVCKFAFTGIVLQLYLSYYNTIPHLPKWVYSRILWVIFSWIYLWRLVTSCAVISDKANEFNTILYRVMMEDKSKEILSVPELRLHVANKPGVAFTACGFFTLDKPLLHTIIAAVTTYLVILIQFDDPACDALTATTLPLAATAPGNLSSLPEGSTTVS